MILQIFILVVNQNASKALQMLHVCVVYHVYHEAFQGGGSS